MDFQDATYTFKDEDKETLIKSAKVDIEFTMHELYIGLEKARKKLKEITAEKDLFDKIITETEEDRPEIKEITREDYVPMVDYFNAKVKSSELEEPFEMVTEAITSYENEIAHIESVLEIPEITLSEEEKDDQE